MGKFDSVQKVFRSGVVPDTPRVRGECVSEGAGFNLEHRLMDSSAPGGRVSFKTAKCSSGSQYCLVIRSHNMTF